MEAESVEVDAPRRFVQQGHLVERLTLGAPSGL